MEILWWLAPAGVTTVLAMIGAAWAGRPRRGERDRSEAAYERFAAAMAKEHPAAGRPRPEAIRDRSTGIAVRPSRRPRDDEPAELSAARRGEGGTAQGATAR